MCLYEIELNYIQALFQTKTDKQDTRLLRYRSYEESIITTNMLDILQMGLSICHKVGITEICLDYDINQKEDMSAH